MHTAVNYADRNANVAWIELNLKSEKTFRDRGSRIMWDKLVRRLDQIEIKQEMRLCEQRKRK